MILGAFLLLATKYDAGREEEVETSVNHNNDLTGCIQRAQPSTRNVTQGMFT